MNDAASRSRLWNLLAHFVLLVAGLVVLRSLTERVNLFEHLYTDQRPESTALVLAMIGWTAACLLCWRRAQAGRRATAEADQTHNDDPLLTINGRDRFVAAAPLIGIIAIGLLARLAGGPWFVEIPVWLGLVGWAALRWAGLRAPTPHLRRPVAFAAVFVAATVAATAWAIAADDLWRGGLVGYADVGLFASRLHNTVSWAYPFREDAAAAPFWDHFNPAYFALTPLAAVFDPMRLLNVVQCAALASVALVWTATDRRVGTAAAAVFGAAWLLVPGVSQLSLSLSYGFHPVTLAMPLFAASLLALRSKRWMLFSVTALAACLFRETVAIGYGGVALWLLSMRGHRRAGALLMAAAIAYFLIVTFAVIPAVSGRAEYVGESRYAHLGPSTMDILLSPFRQPADVARTVLSMRSLMFLLMFFGSLGFLPLLVGGRRLLMLLPEGLLLLLCEEPRIKNIGFHYQSILLVQAFWIVIDAAEHGRISRWLQAGLHANARRARATPTAIATALLVTAAVGALLIGRWPGARSTLSYDRIVRRPAVMAAVADWCGEASRVGATYRAAAHGVAAGDLYVLPGAIATLETGPPTLAVLDYGDDWLRTNPIDGVMELWAVHRQLAAWGYVPAHRFGHVVAYRSDGEANVALSPRRDATPPGLFDAGSARMIDGVEVMGWRFVEGAAAGSPPSAHAQLVELWLRATGRIDVELGLSLELRPPGDFDRVVGVSYYAPAGGMVWPSVDWPAGAIICERRWVLLPAALEGDAAEYAVVIKPIDLATGALLPALSLETGE